MINGLFNYANYQGLKKMLDQTVMRHEAISSNLANLETPNYKRIDVDASFQKALSQAMETGQAGRIMRMEPRLVVDSTAQSPNRDGNTVQLDKELVAMQQNTIAHTVQTQLLGGRLHKIKSAITGRNT